MFKFMVQGFANKSNGKTMKTLRLHCAMILYRDWVSLPQILNKILDLAHAAIIIINL